MPSPTVGTPDIHASQAPMKVEADSFSAGPAQSRTAFLPFNSKVHPDDIRISGRNSVGRDRKVDLVDIEKNTDSKTKEKIVELRNGITSNGGITEAIARDVSQNEKINWSDVLAPGLYMASSKLVNGLADHRHFLYVPADGSDATVITGGPSTEPKTNGADQTKLIVDVMDLGDYLGEDRTRRGGGLTGTWELYRAEIGSNRSPEGTVNAMKRTARDINDAHLNYHFTRQNSNSVFKTIADQAMLTIETFGRPPVGIDNNLWDEMQGAPQAPSEDGNIKK
ncbi:hypothetical protein AADZ90_008360 [Aestuariibius sp. 2305UL40-4]|uniref:hypothetical protein n=1 Tax=Aestuariibius violaceus TaxID=3234132 RepID=UPI00345EFF7B